MWVYRKEPYEECWLVGFYTPKGDWMPEAGEYDSEGKAARQVHYLNGGSYKGPYNA